MSSNINENADLLMISGTDAPIRERANARSGVFKIVSMAVLIAGILALGWFSFYLAAMRLYQVDECGNVYVAHMLSLGRTEAGMDLFQFLLSRGMGAISRSVDMFAYARVVCLMIFWLNWILLAMATGEKIFSRRWLVALAGAATLAPLWDYGFEVRHDNLLLTGILFMWGLVRFQPPRLSNFFVVGACFVALEFNSIKAVLYTFPISFAILVFPPPGARLPRWKLIGAWLLGAVVAFLALKLIFSYAGQGKNYLTQVQSVAAVPGESLRFWPFKITLPRLLTQTPLLVALIVAAVVSCCATLFRDRRAALNWDGILPETLLLGAAFAALFVNPNPYPYNLLHIVPYAFLLAYRYGAALWKQIPQHSVFAPVALSVVAFTHLVPFGKATQRHLDRPNFRQEEIMNLSESLTDPKKDTVYDGIGMVPTRVPCDPRLFIHGQTLRNLVNGSGPHVRDLLAENTPPIVIMSYRTEWLPQEDHDFISTRYVPMADDFWVLGSLLPAGGGEFQVFHAGRYRITSAEDSNIIGTYEEPKNLRDVLAHQKPETALNGSVDGQPLSGHPVELSVGMHRIECPAGQRAAVVWVGPQKDEIPRMPGNSLHSLFVNWY